MTMLLFAATLVLATVLCSLVAGFLFAFAVVVMPGIRSLDDEAFIRAFQVMDRVIQESQPLFMGVWIGSALAAIAAGALGVWMLDGVDRLLVVSAALIYVFGVQAPTAAINVPLNNQIQSLDAAAMDQQARRHARTMFEPRWNRWNVIRTLFACLVSALFVLLLLRY